MKPVAFLLISIAAIFQGSLISVSDAQAVPSDEEFTVKEKKTDVVKLTSRNFESHIADGSIWLVEFYADWCGHCKRFAPTYVSIAQSLHAENIKNPEKRNIKVGHVEGSKERILSSRFSIRGYPSFFIIDGWDVYEFNGIRSKDTLINFAKRDYKKDEPLRFFKSPFGPIGQTRATVMKVGTYVLDQYDTLTKEKKFSPAIATVLLASVGVVFGTFIILMFGLLLMSKQKVD